MRDELRRALRPVKGRLRFIRFWRAGGWGLLIGTSVGFGLLLAAFFFPLPNKWYAVLALALLGGALPALIALAWPVQDVLAARRADACGLRERAQTALALAERNDAMAVLQREDACRALGEMNTEDMRLPVSRRLTAVFAALVLLMGGVALLPDPQAEAVARMEDFSRRMEEAAKLAEEEEKALASRLSEKETQELRKILGDLQRQMKAVDNEREAYLALNEAEKRLEQLRSSLQRDSGAAALAAAGLESLAEALENGDQEALQNSAQQMLENAETAAAQMQTALEMMNGASAQALQTALNALNAGDLSQLQNALSKMSMEDFLAALQQTQAMMNQMRALTDASTQQAGQGQNLGAGQGTGQGQNGGAGRGSTHEDEGYKEDAGRQRGQGTGEAEYKENHYEAIYDPARLEADQADIQESGARGQGESIQLQAGPGLGNLSGQIPYRQVIGEYEAAATQAMSQAELPWQEQNWVNEYFAAITE